MLLDHHALQAQKPDEHFELLFLIEIVTKWQRKPTKIYLFPEKK